MSVIGAQRIDDPVLDREIELQEIARCVRKLKNNKTGGSDGLVVELSSMEGQGCYTCYTSFSRWFGMRS